MPYAFGMAVLTKKRILLIIFLGLLLISIPLILFVSRQKQEVRSRANISTTLSFTPASAPSSPIQKKIGDSFPVDIMVDPGNNLVSFVRLQVKFDPSKIALTNTGAFTPNISAFPVTIEGPVTTNDTLAVSVSIGSDPTKAIQKITKLGTLNFKAIGATSGQPTQITYTALTQALSAAATDQAAENILSSTTPAYITVNHEVNPSITSGPTATPGASTTPEPTAVSTIINLDILLHGLGKAGDNPNPGGSSLSNKNPLHPERNIVVTLIDSNNQELATMTSSINFEPDQGSFKGTIDLGPTFPSGNYNIKIKSDRYLRRLVSGIINIKNLKSNDIPQTALVSGDVKDDNKLNVLDYNILLDCGYGSIEPLPLADPNSLYNSSYCKSHDSFRPNTDLDDNGIVNSYDYNLFLRELSVQNGD